MGCGPESRQTTDTKPTASTAHKASNSQQPDTDAEPRTSASQPFASPKKIVMILLDALRPDYLGFVDGNTPETAPNLAKLSEDAMVFTRAFSTSSWTAPSTASVFTSLYPQGHGIQYGFKAQRSFIKKFENDEDVELELARLPDNRKILTEMLQQLGYRTYGISTNINISKNLGFNRGFNKFKYIPYNRGPAEVVEEELKHWAPEINAADKSFVYLHLNDAHAPYEVRRPYYAGGDPAHDDAGRYRSEIGYVDSHVQQMLKLLNVDDNTLLIVLSDHGEEFMDHGGTEHGPKLYQELVRVLLMYRWPSGGIVSKKEIVNVSHIDLLPTLLNLVGQPRPDYFEGTSLVPLLRRNDHGKKASQLSHRALFAHRIYSKIRDLHVTALMLDQWKLINRYNKHFELYFHRTDPGEHHDISSARTRMLAHLKDRLEVITQRLNQKSPVNEQVEIELDETLLERLRRLGYTAEEGEKGNCATM